MGRRIGGGIAGIMPVVYLDRGPSVLNLGGARWRFIFLALLIIYGNRVWALDGEPTALPTALPSFEPTLMPTPLPSILPTVAPTPEPTALPTALPSFEPTLKPTPLPTILPTLAPTALPTPLPTILPTLAPTPLPTNLPTAAPTPSPTMFPTGQPTRHPSCQPTRQPTRQPSGQPTRIPTGQPTRQPTRIPTGQPSRQPTRQPTGQPTKPTGQPTGQPSRQPSRQPTGQPTRMPTGQPTRQPSRQPTGQPTRIPTGQPSRQPTRQPTGQPTRRPTGQPTRQPTSRPSRQPSGKPTGQPTRQPSRQPTGQPTRIPTGRPTCRPSQPTGQPSRQPTAKPSMQPTSVPTGQPTRQPTCQPSGQPTRQPTSRPSGQPTSAPTGQPTRRPTVQPTRRPTGQPTMRPSGQPTRRPTGQPTRRPTVQPTRRPTGQPTRIPTGQPTRQPASRPTGQPTQQPTRKPTGQPTRVPTGQPSRQPTRQPTCQPSTPTGQPSRQPTTQPTGAPTHPTGSPTGQPTRQPSRQPTRRPSGQPTGSPIANPTGKPSIQPSTRPTGQPSRLPTSQPSRQPTGQPTMVPSHALQTLVTFNVTVSVTVYISEANFKANKFNAHDIFKTAVANTLGRIKPEFIEVSPASVLASNPPTPTPTTPTTAPTPTPTTPTTAPTPRPTLARRKLQGTLGWFTQELSGIVGRGESVVRRALGRKEVSQSQKRESPGLKLQSCTGSDCANIKILFEMNLLAEYYSQKNLQAAAADTVYNDVKSKLTSTAFSTNLLAAQTSVGGGLGFVSTCNGAGTCVFYSGDLTPVTELGTKIVTILHSAKPTGQPTSAPTGIQCNAGYYHDNYAPRCYPCMPGEYSYFDSYVCSNCTAGQKSSHAAPSCTNCQIGTYQELPRSSECLECTWPLWTVFERSTYCDGLCFCLSSSSAYGLVGGLVALYFFCMGSPGLLPKHGTNGKYMAFQEWLIQTLTFCAFTIFPASDVLSDFLYMLTTTFYSKALLITCCLFLFLPNTLMVIHLYEMGGEVLPFWDRAHLPAGLIFIKPIAVVTNGSFLWLGWKWNQKLGVPFPMHFAKGEGRWRARNGKPVSWFDDEAQAIYEESQGKSISGNLHLVFAWIISIILQLPGAIPALIVGLPCVFNLIWIIPWMCLGFYLHQTKALSIAVVWTLWIKTWTGVDTWDADPEAHPIDTKMMNESLYAEFILETLPQLFIQAVNNQYTGSWSILSIFSSGLSAFMAINGVYRFLYYTKYLKVQYTEVPLEISIGPCLPPQRLPNSTFIRPKGLGKIKNKFFPKRLLKGLQPSELRARKTELSDFRKETERIFYIERTDGDTVQRKAIIVGGETMVTLVEGVSGINIDDKVTSNDDPCPVNNNTLVVSVNAETNTVELSEPAIFSDDHAKLRFTSAVLLFKLKDTQLYKDIERKIPQKDESELYKQQLEDYAAYKLAKKIQKTYFKLFPPKTAAGADKGESKSEGEGSEATKASQNEDDDGSENGDHTKIDIEAGLGNSGDAGDPSVTTAVGVDQVSISVAGTSPDDAAAAAAAAGAGAGAAGAAAASSTEQSKETVAGGGSRPVDQPSPTSASASGGADASTPSTMASLWSPGQFKSMKKRAGAWLRLFVDDPGEKALEALASAAPNAAGANADGFGENGGDEGAGGESSPEKLAGQGDQEASDLLSPSPTQSLSKSEQRRARRASRHNKRGMDGIFSVNPGKELEFVEFDPATQHAIHAEVEKARREKEAEEKRQAEERAKKDAEREERRKNRLPPEKLKAVTEKVKELQQKEHEYHLLRRELHELKKEAAARKLAKEQKEAEEMGEKVAPVESPSESKNDSGTVAAGTSAESPERTKGASLSPISIITSLGNAVSGGKVNTKDSSKGDEVATVAADDDGADVWSDSK